MRPVLLAVLLAACGDNSPRTVFDDPTSIPVARYAAVPSKQLDILFQIDDTASDVQQNLANNLPAFLAELAALDGGMPDLHIGVVSSDLGTTGSNEPSMPAPAVGICAGQGKDGALQASGAAIEGLYLVDEDDGAGDRHTNYTGDLVTAIGQMIKVGATGCGFEQHLAASARAFDNPLNAGFSRPDANLLLVILADEDDCSVADPALFGPPSTDLGPQQSFRCTRFGVTCDQPLDVVGDKTGCVPQEGSPYLDDVAPYVDFFLGVRGAARVGVAVIAGPPTPFAIEERTPQGSNAPALALKRSCSFDSAEGFAAADPAVRLAAFATAFGPNGYVGAACQQNLAPQLVQVGELVKRLRGVTCLDTAQLGDSDTAPGVQPTCAVSLEHAGETTDLPACSASTTTDCFEIVVDLAACPATPDHARLAVRLSAPAADTTVRARCQAPLGT